MKGEKTGQWPGISEKLKQAFRSDKEWKRSEGMWNGQRSTSKGTNRLTVLHVDYVKTCDINGKFLRLNF